MHNTIFPPKLKKGAKIAVISPAGSVEESQLKDGLKKIEENGYEVVLGKNLYTEFRHGYPYAGTESQRAEDFNWALNDDSIDAIWASRGGYGCQHLLESIDFAKFKKNPKWYIGYSDNTALQSYFLKYNIASIHGQTIKISGFGITEESYSQTFDILKGKFPEYTVDEHALNREGNVEGQLIGGNLALIYALLGTPYSFDFTDKILFIEDIGEKYYALDRMLMSLELAGVFNKIKGLIVGGMTLMEDEIENKHYESSYDTFSYQIISERISKYNFPVMFGFPNGHIRDNRPLVIGADVTLNVGKENSLIF